MEKNHRNTAGVGSTGLASRSRAALGPHGGQRTWANRGSRISAPHPDGLPRADEDRAEISNYRNHAAGDDGSGRATAASPAEDQA